MITNERKGEMRTEKSTTQYHSIIRMAGTTVIATLMATGCVSIQRQPITVDASAFEKSVEPIMIMPIIDARTDKSVSFDKGESDRVSARVLQRLRGLGYVAQTCDSWNSPSVVSSQQLSDMNTEELCHLLPTGTHSAIIINVDSIRDSYKVLVTSFSISGTFTLIDVSGRKAIWKDAASGEHGGGGVLDAAFAQIGKRSGAYDALVNTVFQSFPKKTNGAASAR